MEVAARHLVRQWAVGGTICMGCLTYLFYDNADTLPNNLLEVVSIETDWMVWAAVFFGIAALMMLALAFVPASRTLLNASLAVGIGACLFRGIQLALVDNQPGTTRWLGIVVYGSLAFMIAFGGILLRRLQHR